MSVGPVFDFELLGPVQVRVGGLSLPTGSGRQRFVLAALLLNAGRSTSAERLIDVLWTEPPPTARAQLYNLVSQWRRRLGAEGSRLIVTRPSGYELRLGTHRLDVLEFRRFVRQGRQAAAENDHESAVGVLSAALSLWRGPALADVADELVAGQRQALHEERLAAAEALLEAQLVLARHDEILRAIPALRTENPYRERVYEIEMLALAAAGRRAEALEIHRRLRRRLVDDLGIEPSPAVAELQQRILDGEQPSRPPEARPVMVPRQLPPIAGPIVGRDKLFGEIRAELGSGDHRAPPVVTLVGPGGVGKSTLALRVGHELAETYVDGQLHADLRGSHERPADPHDMLGRFLRAFCVPGSAIPDDRDERMALYRSRLADRRVLVVLDDAADEEQVRPLLPGTASCAALVTARGQLAALVGAVRWTVPGLCPADSQELLARRVGIERVAAEPDAAIAIVDAVGQLPLAVAVAAARLAARPYWTLGEDAAIDHRRERQHILTDLGLNPT